VRGWGPSHQHRRAPRDYRRIAIAVAIAIVVVFVEVATHAPGALAQGGDPIGSFGWAARRILRAIVVLAAAWIAWRLARAHIVRRTSTGSLLERIRDRPAQRVARDPDPSGAARSESARRGGGAFLGFGLGGEWVVADPEHAVLVLGPPRSGKTSALVIPALLACPGAAVSTSTKPDVLNATARARSQVGELWLFDPTGTTDAGHGARRLCWSPVTAAHTWDGALLMARAMAACSPAVRGTTHEHHWSERSAALLAPLLHAAALDGRPVSELLRWVLRQDLDPPGQVLEDHHAQVACDVLVGICQTEARERSSIFSATAGVLAAYNSDAARDAAENPNFDVPKFVASSDTVYVTAPAHRQQLVSPLVVGLLEELRHATYDHHRRQQAERAVPVFFCLDEVANIAPIHDLPALVSEAGGQGLHVMCCLQDLSQARQRWGETAADGFLSLFQTKTILSGIADPRTLEAISLALGEYDRRLVSHSKQLSRTGILSPATHSESVSYSTQRQRTLPPGEIASLPHGHGLLLRGVKWGLLHLTPWHNTPPWPTVAGTQPRPQAPLPSVRARRSLRKRLARRARQEHHVRHAGRHDPRGGGRELRARR
jgi:hypothetical protein